jgi:hypothetical protein
MVMGLSVVFGGDFGGRWRVATVRAPEVNVAT